jgi:chromosome segregation ATPase
MADTVLILTGILLGITVLVGFEYYRRIRMAHKEYRQARDFVKDIVLSFNRDLTRESKRFESMASKVDGSYSTAEISYRKAENLEKRIIPFVESWNQLSEAYQEIQKDLEQTLIQYSHNANSIQSGVLALETKLRDLEATQGELKSKIAGFEDQIQKLMLTAPPQEGKTETGLATILIKHDKALAALTTTEIAVLEMLSKEGGKTAPEIKERVHLSREHTARLMKKLYQEGYLEREAGKIPFLYTIKKEMEAILMKAENSIGQH